MKGFVTLTKIDGYGEADVRISQIDAIEPGDDCTKIIVRKGGVIFVEETREQVRALIEKAEVTQ